MKIDRETKFGVKLKLCCFNFVFSVFNVSMFFLISFSRKIIPFRSFLGYVCVLVVLVCDLQGSSNIAEQSVL